MASRDGRMRHQDRSRLGRLGLAVFGIGTVLNLVELGLAVGVGQGVMLPIAILALFDAALIAYVFMHVTQLWHPEE